MCSLARGPHGDWSRLQPGGVTAQGVYRCRSLGNYSRQHSFHGLAPRQPEGRHGLSLHLLPPVTVKYKRIICNSLQLCAGCEQGPTVHSLTRPQDLGLQLGQLWFNPIGLLSHPLLAVEKVHKTYSLFQYYGNVCGQ